MPLVHDLGITRRAAWRLRATAPCCFGGRRGLIVGGTTVSEPSFSPSVLIRTGIGLGFCVSAFRVARYRRDLLSAFQSTCCLATRLDTIGCSCCGNGGIELGTQADHVVPDDASPGSICRHAISLSTRDGIHMIQNVMGHESRDDCVRDHLI